MARNSRRQVIKPHIPGMYHVYARAVRRAMLFGEDPVSGHDYAYRRDWILDRMKLLARSFAVEIGFEAVMANHVHLVLQTFPRMLKRLSNHEIARRWLRVFPGKRVLDGNWIEPTEEKVSELARDKKRIKTIRSRLSDVSWFMRALCEYIARRCNLEDDTTGRFWEGRFGCRELEGESALLVCGLYVDLNQIRAGEVPTPEASAYSSVGLRIQSMQGKGGRGKNAPDAWLSKFSSGRRIGLEAEPSRSGQRATDQGLFEMPFAKYLKLLDWVGREPKPGKRGAIPRDLAPILERLDLEGDALRSTVQQFTSRFKRFVGSTKAFATRAKRDGRKWLQGARWAREIFG